MNSGEIKKNRQLEHFNLPIHSRHTWSDRGRFFKSPDDLRRCTVPDFLKIAISFKEKT